MERTDFGGPPAPEGRGRTLEKEGRHRNRKILALREKGERGSDASLN